MNRGLLSKSLKEGMLLLFVLSLGVVAFSYFRVWVVSEIDSARFKQIIELLPKDWERFSSVDFQWLVSYMGRTAGTFGEPPILLMISLWAAVRSSDVVSGELNRGTMEMVLAQPISRWCLYRSHSLVTAGGLVLLSSLIWLGMTAAIQWTNVKEVRYPEIRVPLTDVKVPLTYGQPIETQVSLKDVVNPMHFLPGAVNLCCIGFFLGGVTSLLSAFDRYRWRTLGISAGLFILSAVLKFAALATPKLHGLGWFSFMTLCEPEWHVQLFDQRRGSFWELVCERVVGQGESHWVLGPLGANLLLLILGGLCWSIGGWRFHSRDLPAPL